MAFRVEARWAARTRALDFADSILRVEVPDAGWRRELQVLAPYLATLSRYGADGIKRVVRRAASTLLA